MLRGRARDRALLLVGLQQGHHAKAVRALGHQLALRIGVDGCAALDIMNDISARCRRRPRIRERF